MAVEKKYEKGSVVFLEGSDSENIYILKKGSLVSETSGEYGKAIKIKIAEGELFGVREVLCQAHHVSTVLVVEDSVCVEISCDEFLEMLAKNKGIFSNVFDSFIVTLRNTYDVLDSFIFPPAIIEKNNQKVNKNLKITEFDKNLLSSHSDTYLEPKFEKFFESCFDFFKTENYFLSLFLMNRYFELFPDMKKSPKCVKLFNLCQEVFNYDENINATSNPLLNFFMNNENTVPLKSSGLLSIENFKDHVQIFDSREIIFAEGESLSKIYYIESGEVIFTKYIGHKNFMVNMQQSGQFIGILPSIDHKQSPVTCVAKGLVRVLEFDSSSFIKLFSGNSNMSVQFLKALAKEIIFLQYFYKIVATNKSTSEKVSLSLKSYCDLNKNSSTVAKSDESSGVYNVSSKSRQIHLSAYDIALRIDSDEENVKASLRTLQSMGVIKNLPNNTIFIENVDKL